MAPAARPRRPARRRGHRRNGRAGRQRRPVVDRPLAELPARVNDELAAAVAAHPGRLAALATVDAFAGDAGAEEARRAVEQLGLPGIVVDAAQGELLLGDPQARPTLDYAAGAGVPVFAHPVNPPELAPRYARLGGPGVLLARGTESALSTLGLLADGVLAERPGLDLVLAGIGGAALLLAQFLDPAESGPDAPSAARARLHIDTMGFDPRAVAFAVDVLGPEHVLVGSDWPIMRREAGRERVARTLSAAGLGDTDAALVTGGNAVRLLGL